MKASGKKKTSSGHGWMYYARGAARIAVLIAAFKFVELLIVPPVTDEPSWLVASVLTFNLWGAGAALGTLWLMGRVSQRLFGWPAPEALRAVETTRPVVQPAVQTEAMRLGIVGNRVVLWWFILGFLAIVTMADTGAGPIPRLMTAVLGPNDFLGLETVIMGLLVLVAPPVLLAVLPRQTSIPLLVSMQDAVKPPQAKTRSRKQP